MGIYDPTKEQVCPGDDVQINSSTSQANQPVQAPSGTPSANAPVSNGALAAAQLGVTESTSTPGGEQPDDASVPPGPGHPDHQPDQPEAFVQVIDERSIQPAVHLTEEAPDDEAPPAPFPTDALAPSMRTMVSAVAGTERVPDALPALCTLGVVSAAIGAGLEVESRANRATRANLFLLGSADSGSGKSETYRHIAKPLLDHQERQLEIWRQKTSPKLQSELAVLSREIALFEKKAARATNPEERERLRGELEYRLARRDEVSRQATPPALLAQDVTTERLAVMLRDNRETMFSASPEARKVVDNLLGRYSPSKSSDEALYLAGYSGDNVRVDRQSRETVILNKPCLALVWLFQPDILQKLIGEESLTASGFLARALICHTRAVPTKIDGDTPGISETVRASWENSITALLETFHAAQKPWRIQPTPEARKRLDDFYNATVDRRLSDLADLGLYAARYAEQAWRVALVLHAALHGHDAANHALHEETAVNALRIVEWFVAQQLDILARGRRQAGQKLEDEVFEFLERRRERTGKDYTTARDLHHDHIVPTAEAARALLARMADDGLLIALEVRPEKGGRASIQYRAAGQRNPVPG